MSEEGDEDERSLKQGLGISLVPVIPRDEAE